MSDSISYTTRATRTTCEIDGKPIVAQIFVGTGVCSQKCQRERDGDLHKPYTANRNPALDVEYMQRQIDFSRTAFGSGQRRKGVIDHIKKELQEIEDAFQEGEDELPEWIDVIILAIDGAWRCGPEGHTPEEIINGVHAKLARNEQRTWPDWRTADPEKAIEHDRSFD